MISIHICGTHINIEILNFFPIIYSFQNKKKKKRENPQRMGNSFLIVIDFKIFPLNLHFCHTVVIKYVDWKQGLM